MQLPIFTCFLTDEIWLLEPYKAKSRWLAIGHNPGCNTFLKLPKPLCRIITKKELSKRIRKILFRVLYAPCSDFSSKVLFGSRGKHDATGQNHAVRFRRCAIQTKSRNKFFFSTEQFWNRWLLKPAENWKDWNAQPAGSCPRFYQGHVSEQTIGSRQANTASDFAL